MRRNDGFANDGRIWFVLIKNTLSRFGLFSKLLHWLIAVLILGLIWLGWYMVDLTYYDKWYNDSLHYHKSVGILALALALFKLGWQRYTPAPDPLADLQTWEKTGARFMHYVLWGMMLLIPVTGYLISTSAGKPIQLFNWFALPAVIDVDEELRDLAIAVHYYLAYATLFLVLGHAGAALKHHFINKDDTLKRMLWK